ncbi:MAG: PadR family transcriptional regulator [Arenicella sp.]
MSLKHAILSLLVESERSGYDLTKNFESSVAFYWSASHQQIYKTLADMHKENWIDLRLQVQSGKPDKKIYSLTAEGKKELSQWALEPVKHAAPKNQLLIKLMLARLVGTEPILKQLNDELKRVYKEIANYSKIEKQYFSPKPTPDTHLKNMTSYLTLRNGILCAHAELDWLHEAIEMLESQ